MSDDSRDDAQLVSAALGGDKQAYGMLVDCYQDRVFNTLLRVLGNREDARDVTQEALVQAYVKLESFRGESKFYTWLYRIAMNLALSHRRRPRPVASLDQTKDHVGEEPIDQRPSPEHRLIQQEKKRVVHRALANLADEHRRVLVLREIEQCSYETISQILELPIGTVRSRLYRARMQLKEQLKTLLSDEVDPIP